MTRCPSAHDYFLIHARRDDDWATNSFNQGQQFGLAQVHNRAGVKFSGHDIDFSST
jgi:hypothetical protein